MVGLRDTCAVTGSEDLVSLPSPGGSMSNCSHTSPIPNHRICFVVATGLLSFLPFSALTNMLTECSLRTGIEAVLAYNFLGICYSGHNFLTLCPTLPSTPLVAVDIECRASYMGLMLYHLVISPNLQPSLLTFRSVYGARRVFHLPCGAVLGSTSQEAR